MPACSCMTPTACASRDWTWWEGNLLAGLPCGMGMHWHAGSCLYGVRVYSALCLCHSTTRADQMLLALQGSADPSARPS